MQAAGAKRQAKVNLQQHRELVLLWGGGDGGKRKACVRLAVGQPKRGHHTSGHNALVILQSWTMDECENTTQHDIIRCM